MLALCKPYWAAMNKIFIYARPCVNKMTGAFSFIVTLLKKNLLMLLAVRVSSYGCTWEVWRALQKLELLSAALRATLTYFSCSPNFPCASITRYTHAKHEQILNFTRWYTCSHCHSRPTWTPSSVMIHVVRISWNSMKSVQIDKNIGIGLRVSQDNLDYHKLEIPLY